MNEDYQRYGRCRSGCYQLGLCGYRLLVVPVAFVALTLAAGVLAIAVVCSPAMLVTVLLVRLCSDEWYSLKHEPGFWVLASTWPVLLACALGLVALLIGIGLGLLLAAVALAIPGMIVGFPVMRCYIATCSDDSWEDLSRGDRLEWLKIAALWPLIPIVLTAGCALALVLLPFVCLACIADALGWTSFFED